MIVESTPQPYKVDRDNLPSELRGVAGQHLEVAIANLEKAKDQSIARQKRQREDHVKLVSEGKTIDLIEAAKRCYAAGSHETEKISGAGGGH